MTQVVFDRMISMTSQRIKSDSQEERTAALPFQNDTTMDDGAGAEGGGDEEEEGPLSFLSDSDVATSCAFDFLSARDLAASGTVSTTWKTTARLDLLWLNLAQRRWHDKQNFRLTPQRVRSICARSIEPWFQRFINAEQDARRTAITVTELCATDWRFSDGLQRPRFKPNGELHMELYPVLKWSFSPNGDIIIQDFPHHSVHRTPDWGWVIKNEAISFTSQELPERRPVRTVSPDERSELWKSRRIAEKKSSGATKGDKADEAVTAGSAAAASEAEEVEGPLLSKTEPMPEGATQEDLFRRLVALHERRVQEEGVCDKAEV